MPFGPFARARIQVEKKEECAHKVTEIEFYMAHVFKRTECERVCLLIGTVKIRMCSCSYCTRAILKAETVFVVVIFMENPTLCNLIHA